MDVDIQFIGVGDTVCSISPIPRRLPFTTGNTVVMAFSQAASLDEGRAKLKVGLFNWSCEGEKQLGAQPGDIPKADQVWVCPWRL